MANGGDIIIRGGSVDIQYDDSLYRKEGEWSHINREKKMTKITIVNDKGVTVYDSGTNSGGLMWEVRAHCE
jgi:outer membrane lipoprotein-sorting protein